MPLLYYETYREAMIALYHRGFKDDLVWTGKNIKYKAKNTTYTSKDMKIVEYHRFKDETDMESCLIVFVLECNDGRKGLISTIDGLLGNMELLLFMSQIPIKIRAFYTKNKKYIKEMV